MRQAGGALSIIQTLLHLPAEPAGSSVNNAETGQTTGAVPAPDWSGGASRSRFTANETAESRLQVQAAPKKE
ncbi:MAG: hypothetical protein ACTTKL_04480 [Treponema sp.]